YGETTEQFGLADGEDTTFTDIPSGSSVTVTETDARGAATTSYALRVDGELDTSYDGGAFTVEAGAAYVVTVTNDYDFSPVTVEKDVTGNVADYDGGDFGFDLSYGETTEQFGLADGEDTTFTDIPAGSSVTVIETDARGADGTTYTLTVDGVEDDSYSGGAFEIEAGASYVVTVTNSYDFPPPPPEEEPDPGILLEKSVSTDGTTFDDADAAPGPEFEVSDDSEVWFRFDITNTGDRTLSNLTLTDEVTSGSMTIDLSSCDLPSSLGVGETASCTVGPLAAEVGQHTNVAVASGTHDGVDFDDADSANYRGIAPPEVLPEVVLRPEIDLTKEAQVTPDADGFKTVTYSVSETGPQTISYLYTITNT
ncbi:MAG: DUF5979 domain-containing protein, partial [Halobacteriales archaeon]|nr:DUF5979 domain-containing protein [Halobacteriales archaeon]